MKKLILMIFITGCGSADFGNNCETVTSNPGSEARIVDVNTGNSHNILGQSTDPAECEADTTKRDS